MAKGIPELAEVVVNIFSVVNSEMSLVLLNCEA